MHTLTRFGMPLLLVTALFFVNVAQGREKGWERIPLNGPIKTRLPDGSTRVLHPSCSGGPEMAEAGPVPASTDYYFFVQRGNPNKVLIALDGGGACWDAATCIGSPLSGNSTYTVSLNGIPGTIASAGGIFSNHNSKNPFRNYTKIFIPYCSADIFWGSKDTTYVLDLEPNNRLRWTIRHRGTDNFLGVLDWLQKYGRANYRVDLSRARHVTVAGLSAGGYGASLAFAYIAQLTPKANHNLVSDSAIGVLTRNFYTTALYNPGNPGSETWGVPGNFPSWVRGFNNQFFVQGAAFPNGFVPSLFAALADYQPNAHMASLTTNLDSVQILFYGLMKGVFPADAATAGEWYAAMSRMTAATASLPSYRFFIDAGSLHTFIASNQRVYEVGANGLSVAQWVRAMIKPGNRTWQNLDAGPPFGP